MSITELHRRVAAVCPIDGVGGDKSIAYRPEATTQQRADAKAIADAYDLNAPPPWAPIKAAEIELYIETREKMCARVAGIGQRLARAGDTAGASSCDAVVNALLDVPAHPTVVDATDLASLRLAIKTRYLAAVGLASLSAKAEFRRYDK